MKPQTQTDKPVPSQGVDVGTKPKEEEEFETSFSNVGNPKGALAVP